MKNENQVKLLWTSGWDSTFRLLQLICDKKLIVEPYYIIDTSRHSSIVEIKTLSLLKQQIKENFPVAYKRIGKINFISINEINFDSSFIEAFKRLKKQAHLGEQYHWLARFAEQENIHEDSLEMSVHKDDKAHNFLKPYVELKKQAYLGNYYALKSEMENRDIKKLFGAYRYPLFEWTKKDMETYAKESGWSEIMYKTWFCHKPVNANPCGICNPCRYTVEEGLKKRLPWKSKIRYNIRFIYDALDFVNRGVRYLRGRLRVNV